MTGPHTACSWRIRSELKDALSKQNYTHIAHCGRPHVDCKRWFSEYFTHDRIEGYLSELFNPEKHPRIPVATQTVLHAFRKTFSTLLFIGHGESIRDAVEDFGYSDERLPLEQNELIDLFKVGKVSDVQKSAKDFYEAQWRFLTEPLKVRQVTRRKRGHVMPFWRRERINNKSPRATLWKVLVHEQFVDEELRAKVPYAKVTIRYGEDSIFRGYHFAVKQFPGENESDFRKEKAAFDALQDHRGMIKCLADWRQETPYEELTLAQRDARNEEHPFTTCNLLLEYGQQDLDVYFSRTNPPVLPWETIAFWKELRGILETVARIHRWQPDGNQNEFQGLHADIKPDNLLWVFEAEGKAKLRLADPGLFTFQKAGNGEAKLTVDGGTRTYGAPECTRGSSGNQHSWRIDIWSLGCVLSIAASWVVGGPSFVESFQRSRQRALDKARQSTLGCTWPPKCDFFHNGHDVLPDIRQWHELVRSQTRKTDYITPQILDIVDDCMLQGNPSNRHSAETIIRRLDTVFAESLSVPFHVTVSIKESLMDVENQTEVLRSMSFGPSSPKPGQSAKEAARDQSMKPTAGRTESLRAIQGASSSMTPSRNVTTRDRPLSMVSNGFTSARVPTVVLEERELADRPRPDPWQATSSLETSSVLGQSGSSQKSAKSENIFQAMTEIIEIQTDSGRGRKKDNALENDLKNRDLKFVIDNAASMAEHWDEACLLMETLAWKCRLLDDNGMDLSFTKTTRRLHGVKVELKRGDNFISRRPLTDFYKEMRKPENRPSSSRGGTDMHGCLGELFREHSTTLKRRSQYGNVKYLTIIVLTDGKWEETEEDIQEQILKHVEEVARQPGFATARRPISISFVQLGNDPAATRRLERLDNIGDKKKDVVDTEPADGNIYKMILGSFCAHWDNLVTSPTSYHTRGTSIADTGFEFVRGPRNGTSLER